MDKLIGNHKTYELKKQQDKVRGKKEKNLVLYSTKEDSSGDKEITYITNGSSRSWKGQFLFLWEDNLVETTGKPKQMTLAKSVKSRATLSKTVAL